MQPIKSHAVSFIFVVAMAKNAYYATAFFIQHLKYFCTCLFISVVYLVKEKLAIHGHERDGVVEYRKFIWGG